MFKCQAQWQKNRQSLTWSEKLRLAERVLESNRQWRARPSPVIRRSADDVRNGTAGQWAHGRGGQRAGAEVGSQKTEEDR